MPISYLHRISKTLTEYLPTPFTGLYLANMGVDLPANLKWAGTTGPLYRCTWNGLILPAARSGLELAGPPWSGLISN
jgi:hypothetical protein